MEKADKTFISASGQLGLELHTTPAILCGFYLDLKNVSRDEYLNFLFKTGELLTEMKGGKLLADFSKMANYNLTLRALALNHTNELILKKAPFLLVAIVKSKSTFDNVATQTALNTAKQLSRKFLDGKLFENRELAMKWLSEYPIPQEYSVH